MLRHLTRWAKNWFMRLSSAAHQRFRRLIAPARPNLVMGAVADLPRRRAELLADACVLYCGNN